MQGTFGSARAPIRTSAVAVLAGCLVFAVSAFAQTAPKVDRPDVKVGDQWQLKIGGNARASELNVAWVVTGVTPTEIKGTENGAPLLLTRDMNHVESPRRRNSDLRLLSFPLEVGKSWTFVDDYLLKDTGGKGQGKYSVVVRGYEKVKVAAGEFDAVRLEMKGTYNVTSTAGGTFSGFANRTYWYAPAARVIVREDIDDTYRGPYTIELTSFKLQP